MRVRGPKSEIEKQRFVEGGHGELMAKKWLDSIDKQKRRIDLKFVRDRQTDSRTYRQTESTTKNNRLLA